eukprot:403349590
MTKANNSPGLEQPLVAQLTQNSENIKNPQFTSQNSYGQMQSIGNEDNQMGNGHLIVVESLNSLHGIQNNQNSETDQNGLSKHHLQQKGNHNHFRNQKWSSFKIGSQEANNLVVQEIFSDNETISLDIIPENNQYQ